MLWRSESLAAVLSEVLCLLIMMLRTFLAGSPRGTAAAIARAIGVHPVMVSQWASGEKPVAVERCASIEQATASRVMRWHLRPADWHLIWPELVGTPGAPSVPQPEAERNAA